MAQEVILYVVAKGGSHEGIPFDKLDKERQNIIIAEETFKMQDGIREWFEQNKHSCYLKSREGSGIILIYCEPEAAKAFEKAVSDKQILGVDGISRSGGDPIHLIEPVGEREPKRKDWATRTSKKDDFGIV